MLSATVVLLIGSCGLVSLAEETPRTCAETRAAFTAQTVHPVTVAPEVPISGELSYGKFRDVVSIERWSCSRGASCVMEYTMGRLRDWSL